MEKATEKRFFRATDIMAELDCSSSHAYAIIRVLNAELQKKGFLTSAGRVPATYFLERYGVDVGEKPQRAGR